MLCWLLLTMLLQTSGTEITQDKPSSAQLAEGHYQLIVSVEDTSLGRGIPGLDVTMRMRRGFFILGSKKTLLDLRTDKNGQVKIQGLPKGKVELLIFANKEVPERIEPDLQSGPKNRVQLKSGRSKITVEWALK